MAGNFGEMESRPGFFQGREDVFFFVKQSVGMNLISARTGRYLHMMDVLKPIAGEIFKRMSELVDLYLYTVFTFFGEDHVRGFWINKEVCELWAEFYN